MRVAVPIWENKISPVLDTAEKIRIYEIEDGVMVPKEELIMKSHVDDIALFIADRANVIICGAVSGNLDARLKDLGVKVHSWIMGEIDYILNCYVNGNINRKEHSMPGCRRNRYKCCAGRKNRGYQ